MKLLLDEMLGGLKEYFEVLGCEVVTVHDANLKGEMDKQIANYAKDHDPTLITEDRKPAEPSDLLGAKYFFVDNKTKAQMIHEKIKETCK